MSGNAFEYSQPLILSATVCHQVRCMHWGLLGLIHRVICSYKTVHMEDLAQTFILMKYTDMFSMYLKSGVPRHFH